jgi:hypothetical protein
MGAEAYKPRTHRCTERSAKPQCSTLPAEFDETTRSGQLVSSCWSRQCPLVSRRSVLYSYCGLGAALERNEYSGFSSDAILIA